MRHFSKFLFLVLLPGITAFSCKKEVNATTPPAVDNSPGNWLKVSDVTGNVNKLTADADHLYFSTRISDLYFVKTLSPVGTVSTLVNLSPGAAIRDIALFNGQLYYAGYIPANNGNHLFAINLGNYVITGFDMPLQDPGNGITSLLPMGNQMIFSGNFDASTAFAASPFVAALQTSGQTTAMNGLDNAPRGLFTKNGGIFAHGKTLKDGSGLAEWNTGSWTGIAYTANPAIPDIRSMAWVNNVAYLTYQYSPNSPYRLAKAYDTYLEPIETISIPADGYIRVKEINGEIYAYGNGLSQAGKSSNVFRKSGPDWVIDKLITEPVNDLLFFNGHLYAGTADGIYRD